MLPKTGKAGGSGIAGEKGREARGKGRKVRGDGRLVGWYGLKAGIYIYIEQRAVELKYREQRARAARSSPIQTAVECQGIEH